MIACAGHVGVGQAGQDTPLAAPLAGRLVEEYTAGSERLHRAGILNEAPCLVFAARDQMQDWLRVPWLCARHRHGRIAVRVRVHPARVLLTSSPPRSAGIVRALHNTRQVRSGQVGFLHCQCTPSGVRPCGTPQVASAALQGSNQGFLPRTQPRRVQAHGTFS